MKVVKSVKFTGVLLEDTPVLGDADASAYVLPHVAMREVCLFILIHLCMFVCMCTHLYL